MTIATAAPYTVRASIRGWPRLHAEVASLEDASRLWLQYMAAANAGASDMTSAVRVYDQHGTKVAEVSYNGRIWQPKKGDLIAERPDGTEHTCMEHSVHERTNGPLGDAYWCGRCHALLQVG